MLVGCKTLLLMSLVELVVVSVFFECIALIFKVEFKVDYNFINSDLVDTVMNDCVIDN